MKFTTEIIVVGTEQGAEVRHPGWHGPVAVPVGHQMKVRIETTAFPGEIVATERDKWCMCCHGHLGGRNDYCQACAEHRCDAFPGDCGRVAGPI